MVFKLYLHLEEPSQFTKVYKIADQSDTTGSDLLLGFADAYNRRQGGSDPLKAASLQLKTDKGLAVELDKAVVGNLKHGSDLTVVVEGRQQRRNICSPPEFVLGAQSATNVPRHLRGALAETSKPTEAPNRTAGSSGRPASQKPQPKPTSQKATALVKPFLEKGADAESKQHYRIAAAIYQQVIASSPQNYEGLTRLITLWRKVQQPTKALKLARQAAEAFPEDAAAHSLYAGCLRDTHAHDEALEQYDLAATLAKRSQDVEFQHQIQVETASLLYEMGGACRDVAASLVMTVLEANEGHPGALFQYARIAQGRGMLEDATRVFLRLLVLDQDDSKVKLHLSQCLQAPEGLQLVVQELEKNPGKAAVLAFLATAVKDHGAIPTCIQLFQMAVAAAPENPSYALNLMHAHELLQDYNAAVQVAASFCKSTRLNLGGGFEFENAADAMGNLPLLTKGCGSEWLGLEPSLPRQGRFPTASDARIAQESQTHFECHAGRTSDAQDSVKPEPEGVQVDYGPAELDALALLFTAVKVLYLGGAIARAARLIRITQAARQASKKALHTTLIRNEAAYFSCIAQLLEEHPPPPIKAQLKPLYLCGDSHTLSGAWHTLEFRNEVRLLVPLLVTGCKIWHLREAGRFYPKMAWLSTVESLPDAAQLVFMFGEIDCREGLLLAVDKLKYESMEAAMEVLADLYVRVLLKLTQSRRFEIFVHPVPSVLNETRHVVQPFNACLQKKVQESAKLPEAEGRLHWLDLFDELLTLDRLRMKPCLQFDGTHMNPGYVRIMETALQKTTC